MLRELILFFDTSFLPCLQQRLLQVYGEMFIHTTDGMVVENFILYNIMCII